MTNPDDHVYDSEFRAKGAIKDALERGYEWHGLTKREYFAIKLMERSNYSPDYAIKMANDLIAELNKGASDEPK